MEKDDHHTFLDIDIYVRQVVVWTMKSAEAYRHKPLPELRITPPSFQQTCHSCYLGAQDQGFVQQRNPP